MRSDREQQVSPREAKALITHFIRTTAACALFCAWAFFGVACSLVPPNPLTHDGAPHSLDAFMGVDFGDSFDQVERRFPAGVHQTSPYGARAFKLENVSSRNIEYNDVIYEFAENSGMQMVIAHFEPSAGAEVYQQLQSSLGAPSSAGAAGEGPTSAEASWRLSDGTRVLFSGPYHRLVLIGKDGGGLETDIPLRDQ
jgi:hypothetical protein